MIEQEENKQTSESKDRCDQTEGPRSNTDGFSRYDGAEQNMTH